MNLRTGLVARGVFAGLLIVCCTQTVLAQLTTGGIVGSVTDPSGSRVPGVTVTATEVETATQPRSPPTRVEITEFRL